MRIGYQHACMVCWKPTRINGVLVVIQATILSELGRVQTLSGVRDTDENEGVALPDAVEQKWGAGRAI